VKIYICLHCHNTILTMFVLQSKNLRGPCQIHVQRRRYRDRTSVLEHTTIQNTVKTFVQYSHSSTSGSIKSPGAQATSFNFLLSVMNYYDV